MTVDLEQKQEALPGSSNFVFQLEVFYDGECPLCRREISFLKKKDRKQLILFRDIQQMDFAQTDFPKTFEQLMAEIHGRLPDGTWITGVEVFRQIYNAIGWRRIVAITRWPGVGWTMDRAYQFFAKRRLALTGRCLESCEVKPG